MEKKKISLMFPFHAIKSLYGHVKMVHAEAWGVGDLSFYEHQRKNTGIYFGGEFFFFFWSKSNKIKENQSKKNGPQQFHMSPI